MTLIGPHHRPNRFAQPDLCWFLAGRDFFQVRDHLHQAVVNGLSKDGVLVFEVVVVVTCSARLSGRSASRAQESLSTVGEMFAWLDSVTKDDLVEGGMGRAIYEAAEAGTIEPSSAPSLLSAYAAAALDTSISLIGLAIDVFAQPATQPRCGGHRGLPTWTATSTASRSPRDNASSSSLGARTAQGWFASGDCSPFYGSQ